jgi:hypothetical protein
MSDAAPAPAGDAPPPQHPESGGSISSMVASSASSAAAAAADFTRRGEAFGADMAATARAAVDTATAHAHSSAIAASDAANSAVSSALAAFPTLTHAAKVPRAFPLSPIPPKFARPPTDFCPVHVVVARV